MSEKTITIPYEEYLELQTFKSVAEKDVTMIRHTTNSLGRFYEYKYVYTKDLAVQRLSQELKNAKEELAKANEREEKLSHETPYKSMFQTLLFFNFLCCLAYIIGEYIFN